MFTAKRRTYFLTLETLVSLTWHMLPCAIYIMVIFIWIIPCKFIIFDVAIRLVNRKSF